MTFFRIAAAVWAAMGALALIVAAPAPAQTPQAGGHLNVMLREDLPQGFAVHETSTISTSFPSMPCFNNLVVFDQLKRTESLETLVGELAEKWSWQDNYRNLVFFLRKDVKWHDGKPFTSKDVKFTVDVLREAADSTAKLRINPRKDWYANVEAIETPDTHTAVFRLKKPQPSLLLMLASGYTPVYAAHLSPANYRTTCVGTGPFKLKEWRKGEYVVIVERGTRQAAMQAGKLDVTFPGETTKTAAEQLKKAVPQLVVTPYSQNVTDNIIMNVKKPPFDNPKIRLAVSHAIDRRALIQAVHQGGAVVGAALAPKLMAEAGFSPEKPIKVEIVTRAIAIYVDMASFVINELKQIGIDATLKQIETAQWHATATRGDYQIGANLTGIGPDDPDANYYENYACGSPRNYSQYCNEEVMKMFDAQSQELDPKKRLALNVAIQKKLEADAARPILDWKIDFFTAWPHVKNLIPHQSIYNFGRMQEVWSDK